MRTFILAAATALALSACAAQDQDEPAPEPDVEATQPATDEPGEPTDDAADEPTDDGPDAPPPDAGTETVEIVDFEFAPGDIEVPVGTTVEWTQQDSSLHTVDFEDGEESGDLEQGDTYSRTFDEPGEYPYDCFYHPRMTATVTVTAE
ncbi:MAG: cupredoxin domain-containing protein [Haloechinothrix sp.]